MTRELNTFYKSKSLLLWNIETEICQSLLSKTKMIIKFLPLLSNFYTKPSTFSFLHKTIYFFIFTQNHLLFHFYTKPSTFSVFNKTFYFFTDETTENCLIKFYNFLT